MADYSVSIKLAVAGAKELDFVNKRTEKLKNTINEINKKAQAGTAGTPVVKNFKNLSKSVLEARDALDEAAVGTKEFNQAVKNLVQVENKFERQQKQKERRLQIQRLAQKESISFSKAKKLLIEQERIAEEKLAAAKEKTAKADAKRKFMQGPGSAISSAAIGGAFPLLFGQTGAAAVGGGIGGAAGGLIGGQFGFALSILGTALGSAIDQSDKFNASLASLDFAFKQAGDSSGFTKDRLNELKATLGLTKDEAMAVATSFSRFGEAGSNAAFIFGKNPNVMKNLAAIVDTKSALNAILNTSNGLTIQQQIQLLQQGKISSFAEFQFKVNKAIIQQNFARQIQEAEQIKNAERVRFVFSQIARLAFLISTMGFADIQKMFPELFLSAAERAENRVNKLRDALKQFEIDLPVLQDLMKDFSLEMEGMTNSIPMALDSVQRELRKLMSVSFMVTTSAQTIGDAFGESFKGIAKGTMTAQEALRNLFQRTADAFLDMAAQMIAKQIQMKILGIGFNFLTGGALEGIAGQRGGDPLNKLGSGGTDIAGRDFDNEFFGMPKGFENRFNDTGDSIVPGKALGGPVNKGGSFIVGERGPELFVPNQSGNIIPNHDLAGIGGGGTNIVVNVDASGSSVQSDGDGQQFGEALATAIQLEIVKQKRSGGLLA